MGEYVTFQSYVGSDYGAANRIYTVSDSSVLSQKSSDKSIITATKEGTATVKCKLSNGTYAVCTVTVKKLATNIRLNKNEITIGVGDTFNFNSYIDKGYAALNRTYYVDDNTILSQDKDTPKMVTAKKKGTTYFYVELINGTTAKCTVNVVDAPSDINISEKIIYMGVGEYIKLPVSITDGSASTLSYERSNSKRIYVFSDGRIYGKSVGRTTLTIKTHNGLSVKCLIYVYDGANTINMQSNIRINQYEYFDIDYSLPYNTAGYNKIISISNSNIIKCNDGLYYAAKCGTASITIELYNGTKATCYITILPKDITDYRTETVLAKGVDISTWQKNVDYKGLKEQGIDFIIIRSGYGSDDLSQKDNMFEKHIQGAIDAGLDIGIYHFSYAVSIEEAIREAELCLEIIEPYREYINYPIFFDFEDASLNYAEKMGYSLTKRNITDFHIAFCERIEAAGYISGIYTNYNYIKNYLYLDELSNYFLWYSAISASNPSDLSYDCDFWQYTFYGVFDGTDGYVDCNYLINSYIANYL